MVWEVLAGFVFPVIGSDIGTTMALRGFFGREYYELDSSEPTGSDEDRGGESDEPVRR